MRELRDTGVKLMGCSIFAELNDDKSGNEIHAKDIQAMLRLWIEEAKKQPPPAPSKPKHPENKTVVSYFVNYGRTLRDLHKGEILTTGFDASGDPVLFDSMGNAVSRHDKEESPSPPKSVSAEERALKLETILTSCPGGSCSTGRIGHISNEIREAESAAWDRAVVMAACSLSAHESWSSSAMAATTIHRNDILALKGKCHEVQP